MEDLKNSVSKAVGTKAVMRALKAGSAQRVYVARDIDTFLYQKVTRACEDAGVPIRRVDETKALGAACGAGHSLRRCGDPQVSLILFLSPNSFRGLRNFWT